MSKNASFANLVVKFGQRDLLDYSDVVLRAFTNDTRVRKYGEREYHFLDVSIKHMDENDPLSLCVFGRLVKVMTLTREQILEGNEIRQDRRSIESAPSSFFVLLLDCHRMVYVPETQFAPSLSEFHSTIRRFVKNEFKSFLDREYKRINDNDRITWAELHKLHVAPTINVVPLTSEASITEFISRFSKINRLSVRIIDRNNEISGGSIVSSIQKRLEPTEPDNASLVVSKGGDGLVAKPTEEFIAETTKHGYEDVSIRGFDCDGNRLSGNNESFRLQSEVEIENFSSETIAKRLYNLFRHLQDQGSIIISRLSEGDSINLGRRLTSLVSQNNE